MSYKYLVEMAYNDVPKTILLYLTNWEQKLTKNIELNKKDIQEGFKEYSYTGDKDLVDLFIEKGVNNWDYGMFGAAKGGHKDLVDFFIEKGARKWNFSMKGAAKGGNKELIDFFINKGANNWNWGIEGAAEGGNKE